jgi:hypothetical protein
VNQLQHATVADVLGHSSAQSLMLDAIEELRQVDIDCDAVAFVEIAGCLSDGGLGSPISAEPVTAVMKGRLEERFKLKQDRLLNDAIDDIGNAQTTLTSARFGNPNPTNVTWHVRSRNQSLANL